MKTYKLFIDGKFPRTESVVIISWKFGWWHACECANHQKDFRKKRWLPQKAFNMIWAAKSTYNKGQIFIPDCWNAWIRSSILFSELMDQGYTSVDAQSEVSASIDRLVYYAGWSDKYQQVFSSVNPAESSHFNFSVPEATGLVAILSPENVGLIGLVSTIAPAIVGGNTVVVLASSTLPLSSITFAEVIHSSDVPAGSCQYTHRWAQWIAFSFANHGCKCCGILWKWIFQGRFKKFRSWLHWM